MSAGEIRVADIGTIFLITISDSDGIVDISGATVKQIIFAKPNGDTLTKTASFTTSGSDGKIQYTSVSGDLDISGNWRMQGYVVTPAGSWHTDISSFKVYGNL